MKVIISHDVDHINVSDHWNDFYFLKMWVRSFLELVRGNLSVNIFFNRLVSIFAKRIHQIPELSEFDDKHDIQATYFFGMSNALGMTYKQSKALPWIQYVKGRGFDVGVHGCDYQHIKAICEEHEDFVMLTGDTSFGVRNHYVRYDDETFNKMNYAGYLFDTSEFNKMEPTYKKPYKVGNMWEFPLAIMDGYVVHHDLQKAKETIKCFIQNTMVSGGEYLTILFHDVYYNEKCYPVEKAFYEWLIYYLKSLNLEFISYKAAIKELENDK